MDSGGPKSYPVEHQQLSAVGLDEKVHVKYQKSICHRVDTIISIINVIFTIICVILLHLLYLGNADSRGESTLPSSLCP